jgi:hypothetical protein
MNWILGIGYAVVGFVLLYWAAPLSLRYNAWTTGVRQTPSQLQPAPNSRMATKEYQNHDSDVSGCRGVLAGVLCALSSAADCRE